MSIDSRALQPGRFIQSHDPAIIAFARKAAQGASDRLDAAIRLYYAVRDSVLYDPYVRFNVPETYSAADVLAKGSGFCIPKAALLTACARAVGIPARIGFADVRNHLATPKLLDKNGSDVFRWHAFAEIMAEDRWVKATPAFNLALCEKFGVHPLEWDGKTDSVFHPFDKQERRHMEYVAQHGSFWDVPFEEITAAYRQHCPLMMVDDPWGTGADFAAEAKAGE
ncbi:transglutaminase [Magnetospirillum sp. ME-1]|uniref:transglutaminase-like domain-containing protein n=1 Tax=Magnetospirillum sp. ME-1 TaxID=1639348 RepID=UPI000A17AD89|nr:transglutaminase family protein [Magnetospirillum sp. ME-1]ARJ68081.1 transglutaminase [Magnetospirillum sp. ME-1]